MKNKVLLLGDSLTFGRPKYEIWYENTWAGIIEKYGFSTFHRGLRGGTSVSVLNEIKLIYDYFNGGIISATKFDFCIIQVGIVDCTPRLLPRGIQFILENFFPYGSSISSWLNRRSKLINYFGKPWVNQFKFEQNIKKINKFASKIATKVFFIQIAKPENFLKINCGDFSKIVNNYNAILKKYLVMNIY